MKRRVLGPVERVLVAFGAMCLGVGMCVGLGPERMEGVFSVPYAHSGEALLLAGTIVAGIAALLLAKAGEYCEHCGGEVH